MTLCYFAKALEKRRRRVVITTLSLDGFRDKSCNRAVPDIQIRQPTAGKGTLKIRALAYHDVMRRSTSFKHRSSSALFASACSSNGYFKAGNGALGQSNEGMSNLCTAFDLVVERLPNPRPWNELAKLITARSGDPGFALATQEVASSAVHSTSSPRSLRRYSMNAALKASSLASEPDCAVKILSRPLGATRSNPSRSWSFQRFEGKLPMAGRLASAEIISGDFAASIRAGLL
jgi:hypothetical protein